MNIFNKRKGTYRDNEKNALYDTNVYWMYENQPYRFHEVLRAFARKPHDLRNDQKAQLESLIEGDRFEGTRTVYEDFWIKESDHGNVRPDFSIFKTIGS